MADLTTHSLVVAGTEPSFVAAAVADTAEVGKGVFAVYRNADAVNTKTVTITVDGNTAYGQPNPEPAVTVPTEGEAWIPLTYAAYRNENGRAELAVSGTGGATDVTVAVVKVV